jgi:DNA-binding transcriptional MerR regulator
MSQQFYKPAEACRIAEVAPYVLRYWETEFPALAQGPKGGTRLYSARDVRIISRIRELLYDEGFTVAGAKKRLEAEISEGRFEDGQKPAPSVAEQRKAAIEPGPAALATTGREPRGETRQGSLSPRNSRASSEFPEKERVVSELKEILRLLDRNAKRG